jgi:hypothetical protein
MASLEAAELAQAVEVAELLEVGAVEVAVELEAGLVEAAADPVDPEVTTNP